MTLILLLAASGVAWLAVHVATRCPLLRDIVAALPGGRGAEVAESTTARGG